MQLHAANGHKRRRLQAQTKQPERIYSRNLTIVSYMPHKYGHKSDPKVDLNKDGYRKSADSNVNTIKHLEPLFSFVSKGANVNIQKWKEKMIGSGDGFLSGLYCFSNFNGLSTEQAEEAVHTGFAREDAAVTDDGDTNLGDSVMKGQLTSYNNGKDPLKTFQKIYWGPPSTFSYDDSGLKIPSIAYVGNPEDKFVGEVYTINERSIALQWMDAYQQAIPDLFHGLNPPADDTLPDLSYESLGGTVDPLKAAVTAKNPNSRIFYDNIATYFRDRNPYCHQIRTKTDWIPPVVAGKDLPEAKTVSWISPLPGMGEKAALFQRALNHIYKAEHAMDGLTSFLYELESIEKWNTDKNATGLPSIPDLLETAIPAPKVKFNHTQVARGLTLLFGLIGLCDHKTERAIMMRSSATVLHDAVPKQSFNCLYGQA